MCRRGELHGSHRRFGDVQLADLAGGINFSYISHTLLLLLCSMRLQIDCYLL